MFTRILLSAALVSALALNPSTTYSQTPTAKDSSKASAFEKFKQLAGEWQGTGDGAHGKDMRVKYQVTSGGSAVVETVFPGTDHEMVTVIHPDGDDLLLTHYCLLGNQPQMK